MFNFHLLADGSESFLSTLSKTNLDYETEHIFVTNFTENNTLSIFKHQNIIEVIKSNISDENKLKIIQNITFIDQLILKRQELFVLSSNFTTYHILQLTENGESDQKTKDSLTKLFSIIEDVDSSIVSGLKDIKRLYNEKQ